MPNISEIVSIDTEILIWGIQKKGNPEEERRVKVPKAEYFFNEFIHENKHTLVIPTIVVGEYLCKLTKNQEEVFSQFLENCLVVDFDYKAARIAAEIMSKIKGIRDELTGIRRCITADCKIVATAKAAGASAIYTEHDDIIKLARLINYPTRRLPDIPPENLTLFHEDESTQ